MKPFLFLYTFALLLVSASAVKEYLFKDCAKSGFCRRNRHYATQINDAGTSRLPYLIDKDSITVSETHISGIINKNLPAVNFDASLPWSISILDGGSLRFKIDETRQDSYVNNVDPKRYDGAIDAAFDQPVENKTTRLQKESFVEEETGFTYTYGPAGSYKVRVDYFPVKISVFKNEVIQVIINEKNFLNIEHFRTESDNHLHVDRDLELDFDMFHDSFADSKTDTIPMGPESVAVDVTLSGFSHVYGIPEHADSLSLKDTSGTKWPYRLFNVDIFEYETDSRMPMYGSIPLLVGVKPNAAVGVFWANAADTFVDIKKTDSVSAHWMSENGVMDVVVILGDKPSDINTIYGSLSGFAPSPQLFSLGYHQCRWNYNDVEDVLGISSQMDEHKIPFDTMWLDIEYADRKQYFTWDPSAFGKSVEMMEELKNTGRNLVVIIDPHLKTGYEVSNYVESHEIGIKDPQNDTYKGHCWPGESVWIDSMNPHAQAYWDSLFAQKTGSFLDTQTNVHLWNDMNEPSVFNGPETTSPRDNLHYGDIEHRSVHNLWGMTFHELTHNSLVKRLENTARQRPFILTRSYFAGSQRTAAMWTGDNMATWEYLRASLPMILTSNVVGMPFAGADVGGFFGDPSKELLTRWYQAGIWYPFFRAHAHIDSRRREPWVAGEPYTSIMRDAVRLRYALLPTLYTLFHDASVFGTPVWKPMVYENPGDTETYEIEDQFFLGDSGLLIKPVTEEGCTEVSVYIPTDEVFYDYTNGVFGGKPALQDSGYISKNVELGDIPVFVKGGSIFARRNRYRRSTSLMRKDPFSLVVALSRSGSAKGSLYIDDGESYGYKDGKFVKASFECLDGATLKSTSSTGDVAYADTIKEVGIERVTVLRSSSKLVAKALVTQNGQTWAARFEQNDQVVEVLNPKINVVDPWAIELTEVEEISHDEL